MRAFLGRFEFRVSAVYGIVATLWIVFSDSLTASLWAGNQPMSMTISLLKGLGFVAVTTLALFAVMSTELRKRTRVEQALQHDIAERKRAAEALRASEQRYQIISELISDYAFSYRVEPDGTLTPDWIAADAFTRLTGFTVEEIDARGTLALYHPDDAPAVGRDLERVLAGEAASGEYRIITKSGDVRWVRVYRRPIWDAQQNRVASFYGVAQDITERKRAEEEIRSLAKFPSENPDPVLRLRHDGLVLYANEKARWLIEEWGCAVGEYAPPFLHDLVAETLSSQSNRSVDLQHRDQVWSFFVAPVPDEGYANLYGRDITERKRAEAHIMHLNAVLRAIRGVNQLIVREKDRDRLLEKACKTLIGTRGYRNAWIALLDEAGRLTTTAEVGLGESFSAVVEMFEGSRFPACAQHALSQPGAIVVGDSASFCADCPLSERNATGGGISVRLEHADRVYGLLTIYISADVADKDIEEEKGLIAELAGDIALALHDIELEEQRRRAEAALAQERNLLRTLIDNLPDYVYVKDTESCFTMTNQPHLGLLGASQFRDVLGKTDFDFYPRDQAERYYADERAIIQSGQPLMNHEDSVFDHKTGAQRWLQTSKVPLTDWRGEVVGIVGIEHDITEQKLAKDALLEINQMLQAIIAASPLAIIMLDAQERVKVWNRAAERIFGWHEAEVLGRSTPIIPGDLAADFKELLKIAGQGTILSGLEMRLRTRGGALADLSVAIAALYEAQGVVNGFLIIMDDITERKRMEEALREREILRMELEKERELNQLKTRFISMVSHEYRNPLATILVTSNALRDYMNRMTPAQIAERLDRIKGQVQHMTALMEEVLEIGKMEAGAAQFAPAPTDLDLLCREIVDEFRGTGSTAPRLEYASVGEFAAANIDSRLMRQVVTNLLSNALKYSPQDSPVQVHLLRDGHTAVLRVVDQGIGIPEEDQRRLFTPFHRAGNVGNIGGTGLGLAIVKRAVELHGGTITCESKVDAGTTFTVSLPFVLKE